MTDEDPHRDELAIEALDRRYAALRLASPQELGRVRTSIDRMVIGARQIC